MREEDYKIVIKGCHFPSFVELACFEDDLPCLFYNCKFDKGLRVVTPSHVYEFGMHGIALNIVC